jgi:PadR family transcriptional regulator, regulatory protein PadR
MSRQLAARGASEMAEFRSGRGEPPRRWRLPGMSYGSHNHSTNNHARNRHPKFLAVGVLDEALLQIYIVEQMSITHSLAQFEQMVMAAILALEENAYGVTIHAKVELLAKSKKVSRGAVYATLDRLEDKKLIISWLSSPTKERGGRARRHYRLEKSGIKALRESVQASRRVADVIEQSWGTWKPSPQR